MNSNGDSENAARARLRQDLRQILAALARTRGTVTYRDLAQSAAVPPPQSIHKLTGELEAMIREDHALGRPLLAALVVGRGASGLPQRGFFDLLRELGRYDGADDGAEARAAFRAELERAWDFWGAERP